MKARQLRKTRQEMCGHLDVTSARDHWPKHYNLNNAGRPVFIPAGSIRWIIQSWRRGAWRGRK